MAIYRDGNISGRLGNRVYYRLNGQTVVRKIGINNAPASLKQLEWRTRLKVLSAFFKPLKPFIAQGFAAAVKGTKMYPYHAAIKYNLEQATQGQYPEINMDYSRVILSTGRLASALNLMALRVPEGLQFSWDADPYDDGRVMEVMLAVHFPDCGATFCWSNRCKKSDLGVLLPLSLEQSQGGAHCYLAFTARGLASDSQYLTI